MGGGFKSEEKTITMKSDHSDSGIAANSGFQKASLSIFKLFYAIIIRSRLFHVSVIVAVSTIVLCLPVFYIGYSQIGRMLMLIGLWSIAGSFLLVLLLGCANAFVLISQGRLISFLFLAVLLLFLVLLFYLMLGSLRSPNQKAPDPEPKTSEIVVATSLES